MTAWRGRVGALRPSWYIWHCIHGQVGVWRCIHGQPSLATLAPERRPPCRLLERLPLCESAHYRRSMLNPLTAVNLLQASPDTLSEIQQVCRSRRSSRCVDPEDPAGA